jgi:predicted HTH transcriptional regulator
MHGKKTHLQTSQAKAHAPLGRQVGRSADRQIVKPTAPADFWSFLERERAKVVSNRPDSLEAFTRKQYAYRFGLNESRALRELERLVAAGVLSDLGKFGQGHAHYYQFCS